MKQITLVSLYGEKEDNLVKLIGRCQKDVAESVTEPDGSTCFTPHDIRQIHATIIGLERRIGSSADNASFLKHREREVEMDFEGFLRYLRGCGHFPLEVQIGGFGEREYPFTSGNPITGEKMRPYDRSFSLQGDKVVMMGWPIRGRPLLGPPATPEGIVQESRTYPPTLDTVRHAAQRFGILHGYHRKIDDVDNDLFFRIGLIDTKKLTPALKGRLDNRISKIRRDLSSQEALLSQVRLDDICIAAYEDDRLPLSSTQTWSLLDARVTGGFVRGLFR